METLIKVSKVMILAGAFALAACSKHDDTVSPNTGTDSTSGMTTPGSTTSPSTTPAPMDSSSSPSSDMNSSAPASSDSYSSSSSSSSSGGSSDSLSDTDKTFVRVAAQESLAIVEGAQMAASRATTMTMKSYAQTVAEDHTRADRELMAFAANNGIALPDRPTPDQQATLDRLSTLNGRSFDALFAQEIGIKTHEEAIALFEHVAREGRDPEIKTFAETTLPILRQNLAEAMTIVPRQTV